MAELGDRGVGRALVVVVTEPCTVLAEEETVVFFIVGELVAGVYADTVAVGTVRGRAVHHVESEEDHIAGLEMSGCEGEPKLINHLARVGAENRLGEVAVGIGCPVGGLELVVSMGAEADDEGSVVESNIRECCPHRISVLRAAPDVNAVVVEMVVSAFRHAAEPPFIEGDGGAAEEFFVELEGSWTVYDIKDRLAVGDVGLAEEAEGLVGVADDTVLGGCVRFESAVSGDCL